MRGGFGALEPVFDEAGAAWNVDPNLIRAVAMQESGGNPRALSRAGAQGLMQIIPETQKALGVTDPHDPVQAIWGGAKYLAEGLDKEGSAEGALLYYHGGPDWRRAYGPESRGYVPGVSAKLQQIVAMQRQAKPEPGPSGPKAPPSLAPAPKKDAPGNYDDAQTSGFADFLKRTGAGEAATPTEAEPQQPAASPSHDDFLKRTGAVEEAPAPPVVPASPVPEQASKLAPVAADRDAQTAALQGPQQLSPVAQQYIANGPGLNPAKPFGTELRESLAPAPGTTYGELLPIARDDATGAYRPALPGGARSLLTGLLDLAEGPATGTVTPDATNALAGIVAGGAPRAFSPRSVAAGTGEAIGNRLLPAESPALGRNEAPDFVGPQLRADARANPPNLLPVQAVPVGEAGAAQAVPGMLPAPPRPAVAAESLPKPGTPALNAVGAQASSVQEALMTPKQIAAYRSTAEGSKLLEQQPIGRADPVLYVPGVSPNTAEIEQTVNTARELKALGMQSQDVSQAHKEIAAANSERRGEFFASKAGSKVDVHNMEEAAEAQLKIDYPAAFANAGAPDSQPVVDAVQGILDTPRGRQNDELQTYVKPLLKKLTNEDGSLRISNAEELYGFREQLRRMSSKASRAKDPNLDHVSGEIGDLMKVTDQAIEAAAPGYRTYMDNYAAAQRAIEEKRVLQDFEPKLYDSKNVMQYGRVQSMMKQIVDARAASGLNPYKSISDETMESLWRLRDDLRRSASAQELARAPGSDTVQNALDVAKGLGKGALKAGIDLAVGAVAPVYGNFALRGAKNALAPILDGRAARAQTARGMSLLNPDRNRLRDYDAAP